MAVSEVCVSAVESKAAPTDIIHRKDSVRMLVESLGRGARIGKLSQNILHGISMGLERGIYNRAIELEEKKNVVASWIIPSFIATYKMERHLLCEKVNLIINSGPDSEVALMDPKRWDKIAAIPIYELIPAIFAVHLARIAARKPVAVQKKYNKDPCRNCGKRMLYDESIQTRSADESSTPFIVCDGCNMRIKCSS